jgi:hypothetical protein
MPFPETRDAMEEAGYKRMSYTRCRACHAAMEMWRTLTQKLIPMDPMPEGTSQAVSHYATCPFAAQFRKKAT